MITIPNINCLAMPFRCWDANWVVSLGRRSWSLCGKNNPFITALHRSDPLPNEDPISLLDGARCCNAALEFGGGGQSKCRGTNWKWLTRFVHSKHIPTQVCPKRLTKLLQSFETISCMTVRNLKRNIGSSFNNLYNFYSNIGITDGVFAHGVTS